MVFRVRMLLFYFVCAQSHKSIQLHIYWRISGVFQQDVLPHTDIIVNAKHFLRRILFLQSKWHKCISYDLNWFAVSQNIWFLCSVFRIVYWFAIHCSQYHDTSSLGMQIYNAISNSPRSRIFRNIEVLIDSIDSIDSWARCIIHWNSRCKFNNSLYIKISHKRVLWKTSSTME